MSVGLCPDRELLGSHLLGKVRGEAADLIDQHVATCDSCLHAAQELRAEDELTEAMRAGRPDFQGEPSHLAAVIQRGKCLRSDLETVQSLETIAPGQRAEEPEAHEDLSFLAPPEQPDELGRLGDYRVLQVLGVGGMGIVFRAEDPKLGRLIALKAMRPAIAAHRSAKDRFLREAKATAAIDHDHIVTIHQVGEDRNVPFIAMQFLRGESLQTRLKRDTRLPQREVLRIGREVASGLAAAHKRGLIHRDVKPDNIWLEEETGRVKILDFGLVRAATDDAGLTQSGVVLGTPRYMAPEQAQGQDVDARCDLFSLGSVLYQIAAGKPPFEGSNLTATLIAVAHTNPEPIESHRRELHPDLSRLIMRLLSKNRDQRPASAAEVSEALTRIEAQLGAPDGWQHSRGARPPSAMAARWRKSLFFGGAAVLLLLAWSSLWIAGLVPESRLEQGTEGVGVAPAPNSPAAPPTESASLPDVSMRDREAAQWVLDIGGEVAINTKATKGKFVKAREGLPDEPMIVTLIDLSGNRDVVDDDLERFKGLQSLSMLYLQNTNVGDAGIGHLSDLPELDYVNLVATKVTDKALAPLARLPQLSRLYVSRCSLGDAAVPILRDMKLTELTLDGTQITFEGLKQLAGNSSLRHMTVTHLGLTREQLQQLSDLLPNCQIR
jgi:serine/threonine protein kinase